MFRVDPPPIIRSIKLYLQHLVFVKPLLLLPLSWKIFNSSTIAAGSSNGLTNTRCCSYSVMLLTMDEGIHPKHVEQFTEIKSRVMLHLVGRTLEYIYDAWNPKRQKNATLFPHVICS